MAKIILGKWIGYKYVFIERCPITELQDYIVLKLIQEQGCRLNSPKKPSINLVNGNESDQQRENIYSEFNGKEIDVSDKKNWYLRNNVLFLKLGTTQFGKDILLMIANSYNFNNKEEEIFDIIKNSLLHFDYNVDW